MFTYALPIRPPHGFFPRGFEYKPDGFITVEKDSFCRHGIVSYHEPLSDGTVNVLEIIPFGDETRLEKITGELENSKYIPKYRELYIDGIDVKNEVSRMIEKKSPVRIHPSEIGKIFSNLMERKMKC